MAAIVHLDVTINIPSLDNYVSYLESKDDTAARIAQMEADLDDLNKKLAEADSQLEAAMKGQK